VSGALDSTFGPLAKNLIGKFGKRATLRRVTSAFSAATGRNTESTADTTVVVTPPAPFARKYIDNTSVLEGDAQCSVARQGLAVVPTAATDKLIVDGVTWTIVGVESVYSGELVAMYTLHIRQ
jgi:hypothetical protein